MRAPKLVLTTIAAIAVSLFVSSSASLAQDTSAKQEDCSKFVQKFYDWYRAKSAQDNKKLSPLEIALQEKADCFSPELKRQLKIDLAASAKSPDGIVGLDFDPILSAQDVASRYSSGKATIKNNVYYVNVYGTWNGVKGKKPDVIPELTFTNGKWVFANFDYPEGQKTNLLEVLKQLRGERAGHK